MVAFIVTLFFRGLMAQTTPVLVLDPTLVVNGEVWRLLTYPLAIGFLDLILAAVTFSTPGEEVEGMLGTRRLCLVLLLTILLAGAFHTLVCYGDRAVISGLSNVVLFVLVGYCYLYPHSTIRIIFFSVRSWVLAVLAGSVAALQAYLAIAGGGPVGVVFGYGLAGALFGTIYFHVRYQKYRILLGPIRTIERTLARLRVAAPRRSRRFDPSPAAPHSGIRPRSIAVRQDRAVASDEERLNQILDRINDRGYQSLSDDEREFLDRYSSGLR